jgi:hypothetical protein
MPTMMAARKAKARMVTTAVRLAVIPMKASLRLIGQAMSAP